MHLKSDREGLAAFRLGKVPAAGLVLAALIAGPALAHHSFAMFDPSKTVTLNGTVKEFEWSNPHVGLSVVIAPAGGAAGEEWSIELTSPGNLSRIGWTRHSLKAGDKVVLEISPLRNGQHGGSFKKATFVDTGQVLTAQRATGAGIAQ